MWHTTLDPWQSGQFRSSVRRDCERGNDAPFRPLPGERSPASRRPRAEPKVTIPPPSSLGRLISCGIADRLRPGTGASDRPGMLDLRGSRRCRPAAAVVLPGLRLRPRRPAARRPLACRCPECGHGYDAGQPWVVLRGHQPFGRTLILVATVPLPLILVWLLWLDGGPVGVIQPILAGLSAWSISVHLMARRTDDWPTRWLLWLSPAGWSWQSTLAPGSVVRRLALAGLAALLLGSAWWQGRGLYHELLRALHRGWGRPRPWSASSRSTPRSFGG